MKKIRPLSGALALTAICALTPVTGAMAEDLSVPVGQQADRGQASYPQAGATQSSVRSGWGQPAEIQGPVGQPPITQWHYQNFIVYFEHDRVIHTVLKRQH